METTTRQTENGLRKTEACSVTEFTKKTFSVGGVLKVDPKRDCEVQGHMPRRDMRHGYRCYFCGKSCTVDGQSSTKQPREEA